MQSVTFILSHTRQLVTLYSAQEYEEECSKLEKLLSTMEQNVKTLLSDFDAKKKVL